MTFKAFINQFKPVQQKGEYQAIAEIYDHLMAHVEYDTWADYIMSLLDMYHPGAITLTDAGCGTGSMMSELQQCGLSVSGFDKSWEMVRLAKLKTEAPVWQGNLTDCHLTRQQDVMLCLYDTMQYLTRDQIASCLDAMAGNINARGIFIFDAVTEAHVLRYWADTTEKDSGNEWNLIRRSWYDRTHACQHSELDVTFHQTGKRYYEHHHQWIYSLETWKQLCFEAGLEILGMLEDFSMESGTEESDRIHFILKGIQ